MAKNNGKEVLGVHSKLSFKDFTLKAITTLQEKNKIDPKTGKPYRGIHVVYQGFNDAASVEFPNLDIRKEVDALAESGVITKQMVFGGVRLYLPQDGMKIKAQTTEERKKANNSKVLAAMGIA